MIGSWWAVAVVSVCAGLSACSSDESSDVAATPSEVTEPGAPTTAPTGDSTPGPDATEPNGTADTGTVDTVPADTAASTSELTEPAPPALPARPSPACGSSAVQPGFSEPIVDFEGTPYAYRQTIPADYDGSEALPVVVAFHGFGQSTESMDSMTGLPELGEEAGFVTLTPDGIGDIYRPFDLAGPDVRAVEAMLDQVGAEVCIDESRVYATGISMGGFFTAFVACGLADRFAAVAPVAGAFVPAGCAPVRPVPMVVFHGTADPNVVFEGATNQPLPEMALPIPETVTQFATLNGCKPATTESAIGADVTLIVHDCPAGGATELYRLEGGGHTWPGGPQIDPALGVGAVNTTVDASSTMWEFFRQHALPVAG
jgi:polyhydroxybutyrate depolymerase